MVRCTLPTSTGEWKGNPLWAIRITNDLVTFSIVPLLYQVSYKFFKKNAPICYVSWTFRMELTTGRTQNNWEHTPRLLQANGHLLSECEPSPNSTFCYRLITRHDGSVWGGNIYSSQQSSQTKIWSSFCDISFFICVDDRVALSYQTFSWANYSEYKRRLWAIN